MQNEKILFLDGDKIKNEYDFHKTLSDLLDFGLYYGNNTDALWDRLSDGLAENVTLIWNNSEKSKEILGMDFNLIINVFQKLQSKYPDDKFKFFLK